MVIQNWIYIIKVLTIQILLMLCSHFLKKDILLIMPAAKVSLNISKKKKQTEKPITPYRSCNYQCLNILRDSTIPRDHMALWDY